ncbi:MAG: nucleotide sugar dehydrogenase [Candidatus Moraniibacteriota bacterium]
MSNQEKVGIIGLGYVGLPLAILCAEKGYAVSGFDVSQEKIEKIKAGESPFLEEFIEKREKTLTKLTVSMESEIIKDSDILIICVPTPVDKDYYPDLKPVKGAVKTAIKHHKPGRLIIIESTINPGVCEEVIEPMFNQAGLKEGEDYYLAHCPERIDPGNKKWNVSNISRVVGSMSKKGLQKTKGFYESIIEGEIKPMKYIREAEAVKVVENSFRDINIAFVNELAQSFDQMRIDVKDVIDGAATKPFAFMAHYPGRGVGGHCIPVDPYYLIEQAKRKGFSHKFLKTAREINNYMPFYTVKLLQDLLNQAEMPLKGVKIGVLGLSYKANIDDLRESPVFKILEELEKKGAQPIKFDPYIPHDSDVKDLDELLKKSQALILVTAHKDFEGIEEKLNKNDIKAIVDGMNFLDGEVIKKTGVLYHGIGRY